MHCHAPATLLRNMSTAQSGNEAICTQECELAKSNSREHLCRRIKVNAEADPLKQDSRVSQASLGDGVVVPEPSAAPSEDSTDQESYPKESNSNSAADADETAAAGSETSKSLDLQDQQGDLKAWYGATS